MHFHTQNKITNSQNAHIRWNCAENAIKYTSEQQFDKLYKISFKIFGEKKLHFKFNGKKKTDNSTKIMSP